MRHGWFHIFSIANQNVSVCYQTVVAIEAGKDIALSNKDTLIAGGPFVLPLAHKHKVKILPADPEHIQLWHWYTVLAASLEPVISLNNALDYMSLVDYLNN